MLSGVENLTWDDEGKLAASTELAGNTSYVYDADGNEILRRDPGTTKLFLPNEEIALSSGTLTGTRYYTFDEQTVAVRVGGANPQYLDADLHGTNQSRTEMLGVGDKSMADGADK